MKFGHERFLLAERAGHFKRLVLDGFCDGIQSQSAITHRYAAKTPSPCAHARGGCLFRYGPRVSSDSFGKRFSLPAPVNDLLEHSDALFGERSCSYSRI
jgi:hypothetical protein